MAPNARTARTSGGTGPAPWTVLLAGGSLLGAAAIAAMLAYAAGNASGHTSFNPWSLLAIFVPLLAAGILSRGWRGSSHRRSSLFAILIGGAGIALLTWFDLGNVLLQYEVWIRRGMP